MNTHQHKSFMELRASEVLRDSDIVCCLCRRWSEIIAVYNAVLQLPVQRGQRPGLGRVQAEQQEELRPRVQRLLLLRLQRGPLLRY